jgi:hypothetical protein
MRSDERGRSGLMLLCPHRYCADGVTEIDPAELRAAGIDAVLLDLDNTLVGWQRHDIPGEVVEWIAGLKRAGIRLCLLSNTRHGRRLVSLSERLDVPYVRRAWKPRRRGFVSALAELGAEPARTAMIGDQMFTDVLGGNRMGLYTVMVRPMHRREFLGTKVSRAAEWALLRFFRRRKLL